MVRVFLLLGFLVANTVMFAATWMTGPSVADTQDSDWDPCPEELCPWEEES